MTYLQRHFGPLPVHRSDWGGPSWIDIPTLFWPDNSSLRHIKRALASLVAIELSVGVSTAREGTE